MCSGEPGWKPCVISTNVIDRFSAATTDTVELDLRPAEFGYHTPRGSFHPIEFVQVPSGAHVRIVGYDLDVVARWTNRDGRLGVKAAWGLVALHTFDNTQSPYIVKPAAGRDVLKWSQMSVSNQARHQLVAPWRDDAIVNGVLTSSNTLWIKQAMFNSTGQEVQIETSGEIFFCYQ